MRYRPAAVHDPGKYFLLIDFKDMIHDIINELESADRPIAKAIHKSPQGKCIGIGLKAGMEIKEHKANVPTTLLVIQGSITYIEGDQSTNLSAFEQYAIPVNVPHAVTSAKGALILLMQL